MTIYTNSPEPVCIPPKTATDRSNQMNDDANDCDCL